jgi:16S rRNA (guanine1207-N2)-methyltransferase
MSKYFPPSPISDGPESAGDQASGDSRAPFRSYFSPTRFSGSTRRVPVGAAGVELLLHSGEGVFSKSELDEGSKLLIETFIAHNTGAEQQHICDLGCGWGAIGCVLATLEPKCELLMCDVNAHAAALAALNARSLKLPNARAWCADTLSACRAACFDAVLCNPPVRAGNATIAQMFAQSRRCLRTGGSLWVVLRTAQGAKSWQKRLEAQFGLCDTLKIQKGFRILRAYAPPSGPRE